MCKVVGDQEQLQKNVNAEPVTIHTQIQEELLREEALAQPGQEVLEQAQEPQEPLVRQREENVQLAAQAVQQMGLVQAQAAADGAPIQEQAPAKMGYKARRRERKHLEEAQKACPVGTVATYDMVHAIREEAALRENSVRGHNTLIEASSVESKVIRAFCSGYQVNFRKRPASAEDAARKAADDRFIEDYCSDNLEQRRPHLERMVDEVLSYRFTPDMFTEQNMRKNSARYREITNKIMCLGNVRRDPVNAPYFEQMDAARREELELKEQTVCVSFNFALTMTWNKYGVDQNDKTYLGEQKMSVIRMGRDSFEEAQRLYQESLRTFTEGKAQIDLRRRQQLDGPAHDFALKMRQNLPVLNQLKEDPRLGLRETELEFPYFTRCLMLVKPGEEHYEENLDTVRTMLEVGRLQHNERASEDLYQRAKNIIAPIILRTLDCDVDRFARMNDEELMLCSEELTDLFKDNMFMADAARALYHPSAKQMGREAPMPTLMDGLVGTRKAEFQYKSSMLRGLSDRARGLAMRSYLWAGGEPEELMTEFEAGKCNNDAAKYAQDLIKKGENSIRTARQSLEETLTPGTAEFTAYMTDLKGIRDRENQVRLSDSPYLAEVRDIEEAATPEMQNVRQRLMDSYYYSLRYSEDEVRARGINEQFREAIFRSFDGIAELEATRTLLTPAEFRDMILKMGAGAGMHKGEWKKNEIVKVNGEDEVVLMTKQGTPEEELLPAAKLNDQGIRQYREVLRAQYDMAARKYGDQVMEMSVADMFLHYGEITRDFSLLQTSERMLRCYPDFLNPDDPQDLLLRERIQYYNSAGPMLLSRMKDIQNQNMEQADARNMEALSRDPLAAEALSYLTKHDLSIHHPVDWTQRVRPGASMEGTGGAA